MQDKNDPSINSILSKEEIEKFITPELPEIENLPEKNLVEKLNTETEDDVDKELTEEEKHELFIQKLKNSKKTYKPKKTFGVAFKSERKRKNKQAKKSRKINRK